LAGKGGVLPEKGGGEKCCNVLLDGIDYLCLLGKQDPGIIAPSLAVLQIPTPLISRMKKM